MVFHDDYVILLFGGFVQYSVNWYSYIKETKNTAKLQTIDLIKKLKKIANVHVVDYSFINIINSFSGDFIRAIKLYNMNFDFNKYRNTLFNLEDLDYYNICENVHNQVDNIYGKNKKFICIGIDYGANVAMTYSDIYKKETCLCISINSMANITTKTTRKYYINDDFKNDKDLHKSLNKIKKLQTLIDNENIEKNNEKSEKIIEKFERSIELNEKKLNDELSKISYLVFSYGDENNKKYYTNNILTKTIFIRSDCPYVKKFIEIFNDKIDNYIVKEKAILTKNKKVKYIQMNIEDEGRIWIIDENIIPSLIMSHFHKK